MVASRLLGSFLRAEGAWRGDRCLPLPRLPRTCTAPGAGAVPCAFQPLDSSKLPSPCVWNWTARMRAALSVGLQEAPQSRDGAPLSVSSSHPGILTADPDGGERKGPTVFWEPHQEDCRAVGSGVTGAVGGGTDKCWLVEVNQARPGSPATGVSQPCWGRGAPHLLRTPAPRKESHWSAVPALDTLLCPLLVPVASPLTCCSPLLCQGSPSQLITSVGTAPPAPWVMWHGNPEGLSLKHTPVSFCRRHTLGDKGQRSRLGLLCYQWERAGL